MSLIPDVDKLLPRMAEDLELYLNAESRHAPLMIGIRTGGVWVAEALHRHMGLSEPLGELNINFYRDDFTRIGMHPQVQPTNLPFQIEGRHVILVDDVLHSGRTIRAALNLIFDYGRPASVTLAVLLVRSGRELPVQADVSGDSITLQEGKHIKLTGPQPLAFELQAPS